MGSDVWRVGLIWSLAALRCSFGALAPMRPLALVAFAVTGCATYQPIPWDGDFEAYDRKRVEVTGKPVFNVIYPSSMSICPLTYPRTESSGDCIEVVTDEMTVNRLRKSKAQCVVVSGRFEYASPDTIKLGYFLSDYGLIMASRTLQCRGR